MFLHDAPSNRTLRLRQAGRLRQALFLCEGQAEMSVIKLSTIRVEKPWGRRILGAGFADVAAEGDPVGEIWFATPPGVEAPLLVKYLFTSERLSIQVHPNDAQALARGHKCGKEEAWIILSAEPDSVLGLGTKQRLSPDQLRAAALDGSLEGLMDWKPVKEGDVIYLPAGTVHAIGPGITLIEVQQNVDLTYRLFDYGRPRELHLDESVAVAKAEPFENPATPQILDPLVTRIVESKQFTIDRIFVTHGMHFDIAPEAQSWFIPVSGHGQINGQDFAGGECWLVDEPCSIDVAHPIDLLLAYETAP
jgi:mannose-6-phosphate isomerase